jgi:hypothetical protein
MTKTITLQVTKRYVIEVDEESEIVKEYDTEQELLYEVASYNFSSTLPVIGKGVYVIDSDLVECQVISSKENNQP